MNDTNNDNENNEFNLDDDKDTDNPFDEKSNSSFDFDQDELEDSIKNENSFFSDPIKKKYGIIAASVLIVFAAFFYLTSSDDSLDEEDIFETEDQMIINDIEKKEPTDINAQFSDKPVEPETVEKIPVAEDTMTKTEELTSEAPSLPATGAPQLIEPKDGSSRNYDESSYRNVFKWQGGPATITISRNPDMTRVGVKSNVNTGSFTPPQLAPGNWYWQVKNELGVSAVRLFTINSPLKRNITINSPKNGDILSGKDGLVSWNGDKRISYYRVELSQNSSAKPEYVFSTSATNLKINAVNPGSYSLKIASFSEVSGKWEYTDKISVVVQ